MQKYWVFVIFVQCMSFGYAIQQALFENLINLQGAIDHADNNATKCKFWFYMGSKISTIYLLCNDIKQQIKQWRFNVTEQIPLQPSNIHTFVLTSLSQSASSHSKTQITAQPKFGIEWNFTLILDLVLNQKSAQHNNKISISIEGSKVTNQFAIVFLLVIYYIISVLVLPPYRVYYQYMYGLNFYSTFVSLFLFLAMLANTFVTFVNYVKNIVSIAQLQEHQPLAQPIFMVFVLSICLVVHLLHLYHRCRTFILPIRIKYKSKRVKYLILVLLFLIIIFSFYKYYQVHKDVSTYIFFASGLAVYMSSFFIVNQMKKYYFSFRLVLLDALTILVIGISSRFYPIMHYQIPNLYRLVAVFLIFFVLYIYATILYIYINIIKKDSEGTKPMINYVRESQLNLQNLQSNQMSQKEEADRQQQKKWRKMKQQSMVSQLQNVSQIMSKSQEQNKVIQP